MAAYILKKKNAKNITDTQHEKLTRSKYIKNLPEHNESKLGKVKLYSEEVYEKFIDYNFIQGSNHIRTGKLKEDWANNFSLGVKRYQCDLSNISNMVNNDRNYANNPNHTGKKNKQSNKD